MFGFTSLELRLAGYALAAVGALGAYMWWHHSILAEGRASTEAKYVLRDAGATKRANDKIRELETEARNTERAHAQDLTLISTDYEIQVQIEKGKSDDLARRIALGNIRLYDPGAKPAPSCVGGVPQVTTGAGVGDGVETGRLSERAAQFLRERFTLANEIVLQLTECQAVTQSDRK